MAAIKARWVQAPPSRYSGGMNQAQCGGALRQLRDTQAATCDCDTDSYFRGMYNGLELALATLENREPVYKPVPPAAAALPADDPEPPASTALPANANLLKVR